MQVMCCFNECNRLSNRAGLVHFRGNFQVLYSVTFERQRPRAEGLSNSPGKGVGGGWKGEEHGPAPGSSPSLTSLCSYYHCDMKYDFIKKKTLAAPVHIVVKKTNFFCMSSICW